MTLSNECNPKLGRAPSCTKYVQALCMPATGQTSHLALVFVISFTLHNNCEAGDITSVTQRRKLSFRAVVACQRGIANEFQNDFQ